METRHTGTNSKYCVLRLAPNNFAFPFPTVVSWLCRADIAIAFQARHDGIYAQQMSHSYQACQPPKLHLTAMTEESVWDIFCSLSNMLIEFG